MSATPTQTGLRPRVPLTIFFVTAVLLSLVALLVFHLIREDRHAAAEAGLQAIAELKVSQLREWIAERREGIALAAEGLQMTVGFETWLGGGGGEPAAPAAIQRRMAALQQSYGYDTIALYDLEGRERLRNDDAPAADHQADALRAMHRDTPLLVDFHQQPGRPIQVGFMAALRAPAGGEMRAIGAIYMAMSAETRLFPMLRQWPLPSASGEVVIARREGDEVHLIITRKLAPKSVRAPLKTLDLPVVRAERGEPSIQRGAHDYAGIPVLAYATPVPGTPWVLVVKENQDEVDAPLWAATRWLALVMVMLLASAGAATRFWWRAEEARHQTQRLSEELEKARLAAQATAELRASEEKYRVLVDYSTDWEYWIGTDGRYRYVSPACLAVCGYPSEAFAEDPELMERLIHPDDLDLWRDHLAHRPKTPPPPHAPLLLRIRHREGGERWVEHVCSGVFDAAGAFQGWRGSNRDVTERKRAELELRTTEARYRTLIENMNDGVAIFQAVDDGQDFVFQEYNPAGERISQTPRDQVIGRRVTEVFPGAAAMGLVEAMQRVYRSGDPEGLPERHYQDARVAHWVDNYVYRLPSGEVVAIYANISERKAAEAQIRKLSLAVEQSPESIVITDLDARIEYVNQAFLHTTGYRREEAVGQNPRILQSGKTPRARYAALWRALSQGRGWEGEMINRRKDGTEYTEHANIAPIRQADGRTTHYVAIKRDITEEKQNAAELARHRHHLEELVEARAGELQRQGQALQALLDNLPHMTWMKDPEGHFIAVNRALVERTGLTTTDFVGKTDLDVWPRELAERYRADDAEVMATREKKMVEESIATDPNTLYETFKAPILDADGAVLGTVGFARDIGPQREMEAELERRATAADAANQAKSAFLANMSHEIRTPLNSVLGFAQVGHRENQGRRVQTTFAHILDSGAQLLQVLNDVLDFSKIEAGRFSVEMETVSLNELLERALDPVRETARDKEIELRMERSPNLPATCQGDPLRLAQILGNLLANALKFTQRGEITLGAGRDEKTLHFWVSDTGIGITEKQMTRLFQPFEQADGSITRRFGGTGLGLVISQRLAELMGGEIQVQSRAGEGSRFELVIPCRGAQGLASEAPSLPPLPPAATAGERLHGLAILAAEDNPVNRLVLDEMLAREGCRLLLVEDGRQAVEQVGASPAAFDVVLMDIQMPEMDGYEACRRIRELAPDLPVIGLTAHALADERERARQAGMVDHVAKPIILDVLVGAILRQMGGGSDTPPVAVTAAGLDAGPDIDWAALAASYRGREGFLQRLVHLILESSAGAPAKLREAAQQSSPNRIALLAHSIKGLAGNVMPGSLQRLAAETDAAARRGAADAAPLALHLADELDRLLEQLAARQADLPPEAPAVLKASSAEIEALLGRIEPLLAANDTAVNALFEELRAPLSQALGPAADRLRRRIASFDYPGALEILRELQKDARQAGS